MSAHTPGPWRAEERDWGTYLSPERRILRDVEYVAGVKPTTYVIGTITYPSTSGDTVGALERAANARLVAASPELLAMLVEATARLNLCGTGPRDLDIVERANALIAKARGES